MPKRAFDLIFPERLIQEPVIYQMAKAVDVVFNIRKAKVTHETGEIVLELEAKDDKTIDAAVAWLTKKGVKADPISHDTVES